MSAALDYAARRFAVFPCLEAGKTPATGRGFKEATTNPATIRRWFGGQFSYNIAVATGIISSAWVLDIDGSIGAETLRDLEAEHRPLPPTLTSITAGGCHLWFRADGPMPSSVGRVGPGLDVRADGGYVLAPPSVHPDGPRYRWGNDRPIATAPNWLTKLVHKRPSAIVIPIPQRPPRTGSTAGYGRSALERECHGLANAPPGTRNHALNRASFSLHQLVAGAELDPAEVRHRLIEAAIANGLVADDGLRAVERTIASGAGAGMKTPRRRASR